MNLHRPGFLTRWLFNPDGPAPFRVRAPLFVTGLLVLGASYWATGSEDFQLFVLVGLTFIVYPLAARVSRPAKRDEFIEIARTRNPPTRVLLLSILSLALWWGIVILLPNLGMGFWFWFWVLMIPFIELYTFLARREFQRRGAEAWPRFRPVRDSALAGAAIVPFVFLILIFDMSVGEAIANALGCGVIVFVMSTLFAFGIRRAEALSAGEPTPRRSP